MKFILFYALTSICLLSCGKQTCEYSIDRPREIKFGPLEVVQCPLGEVLGSVTPVYEAGGKVTHVLAVCGLQVVKCQ